MGLSSAGTTADTARAARFVQLAGKLNGNRGGRNALEAFMKRPDTQRQLRAFVGAHGGAKGKGGISRRMAGAGSNVDIQTLLAQAAKPENAQKIRTLQKKFGSKGAIDAKALRSLAL